MVANMKGLYKYRGILVKTGATDFLEESPEYGL